MSLSHGVYMDNDNVVSLTDRLTNNKKSKSKTAKKSRRKKSREEIVTESNEWGINASRAIFDSWREEDGLDQIAILFFLTNFVDDLLFTGCPPSNILLCISRALESQEERLNPDDSPTTATN